MSVLRQLLPLFISFNLTFSPLYLQSAFGADLKLDNSTANQKGRNAVYDNRAEANDEDMEILRDIVGEITDDDFGDGKGEDYSSLEKKLDDKYKEFTNAERVRGDAEAKAKNAEAKAKNAEAKAKNAAIDYANKLALGASENEIAAAKKRFQQANKRVKEINKRAEEINKKADIANKKLKEIHKQVIESSRKVRKYLKDAFKKRTTEAEESGIDRAITEFLIKKTGYGRENEMRNYAKELKKREQKQQTK